MPDLPYLSQTDVTIQNQSTGQIDYLKYEGSTLTGSMGFNYGLGTGWNIVASANGTLVAQNQSTGFVDFLNIGAGGALTSSAMSTAPMPRIFGYASDLGVFGSQLADGEIDFLQFNTSTGALTGSQIVGCSVGLPKAVTVSAWGVGGPSPAWLGLGTGDVVETQTADGSPDIIGFTGTFPARNLAVNSSYFISAPGTPSFVEANPDIANNWNLQDSTFGAPQGLQEIAQTASGQIDSLYYDTGMGDPGNEGLLYASNMLGSFPGWNVVPGSTVNHNLIFPVT